MPRLRQVARADASADVLAMYDRLFGDRDPVAEPGTATGTPGTWWTVFALVPEIFNHCVASFGMFNSKQRVLPPRLRELGLTRTGFARGSQFVFSQHCKAARAVGLSEEQVAAIPAWTTADCWSPAERAVLAWTDGLILADGRIPDAAFAALQAQLSDEAILELTYAVASYGLHATICRALRLEYDDLPERIVEIPAPDAGAEARDILRAISRTDAESP